jgi:hypothetical protein
VLYLEEVGMIILELSLGELNRSCASGNLGDDLLDFPLAKVGNLRVGGSR